MATIRLDIVSPDKGEIFSKDINMLIVRSTAGELGILPRHANLLTELLPHAMKIKMDGGENLVALGGGFMEVTPEKITVLADSAELPEDIDVERAQRAKQRAEERIAQYKQTTKETLIDIDRANRALARAKARLLVKNALMN
ncbi:MAG: F0F1 ATP synthase subunit epsilon [Selenomonadaceae bacterium]|nr:F0F1 ATP synthase subunit epsilon [Selenomonadaceae bacterium]